MTLRFWLTTVCSTIVSVTTLYFGLNYSKFCFKQMRYLSDKEKIQMAFNYQNNRERIPIETVDKGTQYYRQIRYDNFEEFIQKNQNCIFEYTVFENLIKLSSNYLDLKAKILIHSLSSITKNDVRRPFTTNYQ